MKNKSLEQIFREKLGELKIEPSERAIDVFNKKLKSRGRIVLIRKLSVAAGLFLIGLIAVLYFNPGAEKVSLQQEIRNPYEVQPTQDNSEINPVNPDTTTETLATYPQLSAKKQNTAIEDDNHSESLLTHSEIMKSDPAILPEKNETLYRKQSKEILDTLGNLSDYTNGTRGFLSGVNEDSMNLQSDLSGLIASRQMEDRKPVKITIEYFSSGSKDMDSITHKSRIRALYAKMNELVYPDDVLGDVRSFKDQLFTLDFIKRDKSEIQNRK